MLKCLIAFILGWFLSRHMGNGFRVGGEQVKPDCNKLKKRLLVGFNSFEKLAENDPDYKNWKFDDQTGVWNNPHKNWGGVAYRSVSSDINTPGCNFPKKYIIRDSDGIITDISPDRLCQPEPTIENYFPQK